MSDNTKIEWTDATWNVITGCSVVSAGCRHCYAMKLAGTRLQHHPSRAGLTIDTAAGPVWNGQVRFNEQWLTQPLAWKRPRKVFVCAHGDLFHESVPDAWIDRVFAVMALAPQHTFQVLTKRSRRMREYLDDKMRLEKIYIQWHTVSGSPREAQDWPLPNVWLGVSVEDQAAADERIPLLLETPAAVRWISAEPLLGPVTFRSYTLTGRPCFVCKVENDLGQPRGSMSHPINCGWRHDMERSGKPPQRESAGAGIDWVVVGGESGTNARPMNPDWARSLRDQCAAAGVPFLFKQWGEYAPNWYNDDAGNKIDGSEWTDRVGKKAAGRLLDGKLHDGYPGDQ